MTVIKEEINRSSEVEGTPMGRTFAMVVVSAGYGTMTAGLVYVIGLFLRAGDDPEIAAVVPMFVGITALVGIIGALTLVWSGAPRRSWFWLMAVVPGLFILLMNAPYLAYDITRPANIESFLVTIVVLAGALAIIFGGIAAFLEARRGRPSWTRAGRAGWITIALVGALLGAATTSALTGLASSSGAGVAEEPTVTGVLTAEKTAFIETSLHMSSGEVLGLFVVNRDTIAHSFDIDSLDIHVSLPPNSTTAVALKPPEPGSFQFYCGVPGHRDAGMVGTIEVDA